MFDFDDMLSSRYHSGICSNFTKGCICNRVKEIIYSGEYCQDAIFSPSAGIRSLQANAVVVLTFVVVVSFLTW